MYFSILNLFNSIPLSGFLTFIMTFNKKIYFKCSKSLDPEKKKYLGGLITF